MTDYDIIIIGGGMAGASLGAEVAAHARVLVLEMEEIPGYHATGRSVSFWQESYGGPAVQPLTSASGPLLRNPDPSFSETSFLTPRGALHIGRERDQALRADFLSAYANAGIRMDVRERAEIAKYVPGLRTEWTLGIAEPSTADIDTTALHSAYLRQLGQRGGVVKTGTGLLSAKHLQASWLVDTGEGQYRCQTLFNAAGAWADDVAQRCGVAPMGITPLQRTVVQLRTALDIPTDLPLILDLNGTFYFKPVGNGRIWLSPHDEEPRMPGDAAPEELAVATAISRLQHVVDWPILAVERKWAGLRSFAPDRLPIYGYDAHNADFFWFAGQGGFGIQTSPAAAQLGAALLLRHPPNDCVAGIDAASYAPARFAR